MNHLFGIILVGFLFLSTSCEKEEIFIENDKKSTSPKDSPVDGEGSSREYESMTEVEALDLDLNNLLFQTLNGNSVNIKNAVVKVIIPSENYEWKGSWGSANPDMGIQATNDDQFYAASIGKMTLSTLSLLLIEQGHFGLNDPISMYLHDSIMNNLHVIGNNDYSDQITIKHLLRHTSGLQDYFEDGDANYNQIPDFQELMMDQPMKIWEPYETLNFTKENLTPLFPPGTSFHYSDGGYVLMGMILENVTGNPLAELYQDNLWQPLNIDHTYFYYREPPIAPVSGSSFSHAFSGAYDMMQTNMLSADWAGGGLITTTDDLGKFIVAWQNNQIFQDPSTKDLMTDYNSISDYGLGNWSMQPNGFQGTLIGHEGSSQSFMWYVPEYDGYIIGTFNQTDYDNTLNMHEYIKELLIILKDHQALNMGMY